VILALAQINPTVGDFLGNLNKIAEFAQDARTQGAQLVIFPEMALCGYPPADLLERPAFLARCQEALEEVAAMTSRFGIAILCGCITPAHRSTGKSVMNSAALLQHGRIEFLQSKRLLPYYDVFDEQRYFAPAESQSLHSFGGEQIAFTICEDAWNDKNFWARRLYSVDPVEQLIHQGASLVINISASPYYRDKRELRREMLSAIARHHNVPVVMVNQVGGNDSLIFDGTSLAMAPDGTCIARGASFKEDLVLVDTVALTGDIRPSNEPSEDAAVYNALVLGTRDYVRKCGFSKAIVGLSGGIDSALVAAIAADALGKENVLGVGMPSEYSSTGSIDDARQLAGNLGIDFELIPIQTIFHAQLAALDHAFQGKPQDTTEENLQSRIRGTLLMALSNKHSALVLTTGNKSEMAVGYCTLYGDMVGALAVIGDVLKTVVYRLSHYVNRDHEIIPKNTLIKAPSAELRPGQKDTDALPPYDVLDPILEAYVEHYQGTAAIAVAQGQDLGYVRKVLQLVERSEYKRQQAAPVLKVTEKSFGTGRRFPIAVKVQV
jgi:NAD+ synthase/NAD+ synthase (glutamine-hydrolysing)